MAEQFNFGEAIIEIISDPHHLIAGFKKAEEEGASFAGRMGALMKSVALIALPAGIATGIYEFIKHTTESVAELRIMSQQVGVSVEDLTALQFAGVKTGVAMEYLMLGLRLLSRQMVKGEDEFGKASRGLEHLGIKSHDANGALRSTTDVMADVADKFFHMRDGAEKTALAVELFGRSGSRLVPLLNLGREGFKRMREEAERMGYVVSEETAEAAHKLEIQLKSFTLQLVSVGREILANLLPALTVLTMQLDSTGQHVHKSAEVIADWTDYLLKPKVVLTELALAIRQILYLFQMMATLSGKNLRLPFDLLTKPNAESQHTLEEFVKDIDKVIAATEKKMAAAGDRAAEALVGPVGEAARAAADEATRSAADSIKTANKAMEIAILGKKGDIAALRDQVDLEEMYAAALDKVAYEEAVAAGRNETLARIIMDLAKQYRDAKRAAEEKKQADIDAAKEASEAAAKAKHDYDVETHHQRALYQQSVELGKARYDAARTFFDYMRESNKRSAELRMNDQQKEIAEARDAHDRAIEGFSERLNDRDQFNAAVARADQELLDNLEAINQKYHTSELRMLAERVVAHQSAARLVLDVEMSILDDLQSSMSAGFFDVMSGKFNDLDDVIKNFFASFKRHIADFLADLVMKELEKWLLRLAMQLGSKYFGSVGTSPSTPAITTGPGYGGLMAMGGVVRAAMGRVVQGPTMVLAGEGGMDEAVVPMPSGKVPVQLLGKSREQPLQIQQAIRVVIGNELMAQMRTSPDAVIAYVGSNIRSGGTIYNLIQSHGKR